MAEHYIRARIPERFYDDHRSRDLPSGLECSRNGSGVLVDLTPAELVEMLSDAEHYTSSQGWDPDLVGLRSSARATVKRLAPLAAELEVAR